jgi:hypothetical protein
MKKYEPKMQIVYIPTHAEGDAMHKDVEFGFVTSISPGGSVFCRFWMKDSDSSRPVLRTIANSEACNTRDIRPFHFTDQSLVEAMWKAYCT